MSIESKIHALVRSIFPTEVGAAAVMGNIAVETGNTFNYQQKQHGGNGYGLFQFDFLKPHYRKWLAEVNAADSAEAQIMFVHATIYGTKKDLIGAGNAKKVADALGGKDLDNATKVFCDVWEKPGVPHLDRRLVAARSYLHAERN